MVYKREHPVGSGSLKAQVKGLWIIEVFLADVNDSGTTLLSQLGRTVRRFSVDNNNLNLAAKVLSGNVIE